MLEVCKRITSKDELRNVSIKGLKINEYEVQTALTNHPTDIGSATSDILRNWRASQISDRKAYVNLQAAFLECQMNQLAGQLRQWVESTSETEDTNSGQCRIVI